MVLYTKCIVDAPTVEDGVRICIMRNPDSGAHYDLWLPQLAPSVALRQEIKRGTGQWDAFKGRFLEELREQTKYLDFIGYAAVSTSVTLLCVEREPHYCHRSLVAAAIGKRHTTVSVVVK